MEQGGRRGRQDAQASRHPEVQDRRAVVESQQEVFGAPRDGADNLAANGGFEALGDGPP
jgi:hypothetical protein